ncbi:hypothetical protein NP493_316g02062 [Ridgeia piscesae]|uniref:Protein quiver n=1 Tax=Ridgeia piscesae TaxID=27915 RepID=A0AAD9L536_RIDPI|nr:hypothetical protein NP493_316g02062 [Ridgeia piscesae]
MNTILSCGVLLAILACHTADGAVNCYTCTMVEGVSRDDSCADPFVGSRTKRCSGLSCSKMKTQLNGRTSMSRGCWPKNEESCYTKEGYGTSKVTVCACFGDYCNAAVTRGITSHAAWFLEFCSIIIIAIV